MRREESILTYGAAGVLLMSGVLVQFVRQPAEKPRERSIPVMVTGSEDHPVPVVAEGRLLGRPESSEVTVISPEFGKPLWMGPPVPVFEGPRPPNFVGYSSIRQVAVPRGGVELLSKKALVTSSDPAPLGELSMITDGEKEGDDGYFVDLLPFHQWVQIDLGKSREVWLVWMWHYHKRSAMYKDVIIQISDDPSFREARTVFNNDYDDTSGMGKGTDESWMETSLGHPVKVSGVRGRYVRIHSNGRDIDGTNQWIEVEVYGR
jgi:hypothetical protein